MSILQKIKQGLIYKILKTLKIIDLILFIIERWNDIIRFLKGPLVRDFFLTLYLLVYCIFVHKPPKAPSREAELIISLTSYPARMNTIYLTLFCLIRQKEIPSKIVLWLAKEQFDKNHTFNFFLRLLLTRGVTIEWTNTDTKSYKKLLPSLKKYPEAIIVLCDDDVIYPNWWLQQLYATHLNSPNSIIGHKGIYLSKKNSHTISNFKDMVEDWSKEWKLALHPEHSKKIKQKYTTPSHNIFLEGIGGMLIPPHSFSEEIHKQKQYMKLSPTADDIWFNAMAILHDTPRSAISSHYYFAPSPIHNTQQIGLHTINIDQGLNDVQFKKVFDEYDLYKFIK